MALTKTGWSEANFVAGVLCLDFANTLSGRHSNALHERMSDYEQLIRWGRCGGILDRGANTRLTKAARLHPRDAEAAYRRAIELREAIFGVFHAKIVDSSPLPAHMSVLNKRLSRALRKREVAVEKDGFAWRWNNDSLPLEYPLWPVAYSAAELLVGEELSRVCLCEGAHCGWLFVDRTKNHSRRWCDMAVCGNRAKAHRHYDRRASKKGC